MGACKNPVGNHYGDLPPVVKVSFDLNNGGIGEAPVAREIDENGQVELPELPEETAQFNRDGEKDIFIFSGWSKATDDPVVYLAGTMFPSEDEDPITADTTLFAVWYNNVQGNFLQVTFDPNFDEKAPVVRGFPLGSRITFPPAPDEREGYEFLGWDEDKDTQEDPYYIAGKSYGFVETEVTVFAVWKKLIRLEFHPNGGEGEVFFVDKRSGSTHEVSNTVFTPPEYKNFVGWDTDPQALSSGDLQYPVLPNSDLIVINVGEEGLILHAIWHHPQYTVSFKKGENPKDDEDGYTALVEGSLDDIPALKGEDITLPEPQQNEGIHAVHFILNGWYEEDGHDKTVLKPGTTYKVERDITFLPTWRHEETKKITIRFDANGGKLVGAMLEPIQEYQSGYVTLPGEVFEREAEFYRMKGWSKSASATEPDPGYGLGLQIKIDRHEKLDLTLYAVWYRPEFKFIYHANGGTPATPVEESNKPWGSTQTLRSGSGFAMEYRVFDGWNAPQGFFSAGADFPVSEGDTTFYAVWKPVEASIRFDSNGGNTSPVPRGTYWGDTPVLPNENDVQRENHVLLGWSKEAAAVIEGNAAIPVNLVQGTNYWAIPGTYTVPRNGDLLYAVWRRPMHTVTYLANGGTGNSVARSELRGTQIKIRNNDGFDRGQWDFKGWHEHSAGTEGSAGFHRVGADFTIVKDTDLYAVWKLESYDVEFRANFPLGVVTSGTVPQTVTIAKGETYRLPDQGNLSAHTYTFAGWVNENGLTMPAGYELPVFENTVLRAQWQGGGGGIIVTGSSSIQRGGSGNFKANLFGGITAGEITWELIGHTTSDDESKTKIIDNKDGTITLNVDEGELGIGGDPFNLNSRGKLTLRAYSSIDPAIQNEVSINLFGRRKLGDWRIIRIGQDHTMSIAHTGQLYAWGLNNYGQLGIGTSGNNTNSQDKGLPQLVGSLSDNDWLDVAGGNHHSLGIRRQGQLENRGGTLWAWGRQTNGKLGNGDTSNNSQLTPSKIGIHNDWVFIAGGRDSSYGIRYTGIEEGTDKDANPYSIPYGTLYAWGNADYGQIGDGGSGSTGHRNVPTPVGSADQTSKAEWEFKSVSAYFHVVAIRKDNTLWAWGRNDRGQVDPDTKGTNVLTPIEIKPPAAGRKWIAANASGDGFTVALDDQGDLWSWGRNSNGRLGQGNSSNDRPMGRVNHPEGKKWKSADSGQNHVMAIDEDNNLYTWGLNGHYQVTGIGTGDKHTPHRFGTPSNDPNFSEKLDEQTWVSVNGGGWFSLGVRKDGQLWAWGDNKAGNLGISATVPGVNKGVYPTRVRKP